jgi:ribosomal protein S12 methylthiotransferase accessory factor YcaO
MRSGSGTPAFCFSRNPAEAFLGESNRADAPSGWDRQGLRTLDTFLRDLAELRQVEYTHLKTDPRRFKDAAGTDFTCAVTVDIKFRHLPLIQSSGYGYGASERGAKLIALAECLERLGFCLRGWHDAASRARNNRVFEAVAATDNTNGACFHTSPLQALKGAFCELLERDAFLAAWYADRPLPVTPIARGHRLYPLARRFAAEDWELREHCWVHDRVPAVFVGLSLTRNAPARDQWNFFFGSGAAPGADEAQDKALNEVLKSRRQSAGWSVGTSGRATPAQLRSVESRRILYQRPAFVRKFTERLARRPSAPVPIRDQLSDRDFVVQCFRNLPSAKVVPLLLPGPFRDTAFCVQVVCDELQGLDWQIPPRYNMARIRS